jgi:large subunit ribosomal protein L10
MPSERVLIEKKQIVVDLIEKLKSATAGVLVDYCGLTVEEDTNLRNKLRAAEVDYKVVKNTITRFAANEIGFSEFDDILNGPTSLALSFTDPVAPAKIISEFAKDNKNIEIKGGFLDGKVITLDEIKILASTPSRDTLLAKIMGSLNAPVSSLARVLQAIVDNGVEPSEIVAGPKAVPVEPEENEPVAEAAPAETEEASAE